MGFPWWLSDSVPGLGRSPGEAKGYPLQYSCLENPMDQGSLAGYCPWGHKESDTAERLTLHFTSWEDARIWAREVPPETDTSPSKGPLFHNTEYPAATLAPFQEHCVRACNALQLHPRQGPAPAGSRGTLRMNSVSEWEREWDKAGGWVWSLFLHGPFIPSTTSFGGSAYCLHTGHLKTLQQLDLQQKQDVTHILFVHKSFSYHLAFRPANIWWLAPGVT